MGLWVTHIATETGERMTGRFDREWIDGGRLGGTVGILANVKLIEGDGTTNLQEKSGWSHERGDGSKQYGNIPISMYDDFR